MSRIDVGVLEVTVYLGTVVSASSRGPTEVQIGILLILMLLPLTYAIMTGGYAIPSSSPT